MLAFPFPDALEVARLSVEEQEEYAAAFGLPGPAAEVVAQAAFAQLGLISFLTTGSDEVRAWPIGAGETAREAAGAIHSDIQRGFIRAEVVSYDDFMRHGDHEGRPRCGGTPHRRQGLRGRGRGHHQFPLQRVGRLDPHALSPRAWTPVRDMLESACGVQP